MEVKRRKQKSLKRKRLLSAAKRSTFLSSNQMLAP